MQAYQLDPTRGGVYMTEVVSQCSVSLLCYGLWISRVVVGWIWRKLTGRRSDLAQVDELVKLLTSEEFKDKIIVILAGYGGEMEQMLSTNAGLKSRFAERLNFEDLGPEAVADLFEQRLRKEKLEFPASARAELVVLAQRLAQSDAFGNGRDVDTWCKFTYAQVRKSSRPAQSFRSCR